MNITQESETVSEGHPASAGFLLPQKLKSTLTPAEQKGQVLYAYYCALCHGKTGSCHSRSWSQLAQAVGNLRHQGFCDGKDGGI